MKTGRTPRVLLVDAHADSRHVYGVMLRHAGYEVSDASDAAEGLRLARSTPPALVLTELALPGTDGFEFIRLLRKDPATRDVPVLVVTTLREEHLRATELPGCAALLAKPCTPRQVVSTVNGLLEAAPALA